MAQYTFHYYIIRIHVHVTILSSPIFHVCLDTRSTIFGDRCDDGGAISIYCELYLSKLQIEAL